MPPQRRLRAAGDSQRADEREWERLRLRAAAYRRGLTKAQADDDVPALRRMCREGLQLLAEMEGFVGRVATRPAAVRARE